LSISLKVQIIILTV